MRYHIVINVSLFSSETHIGSVGILDCCSSQDAINGVLQYKQDCGNHYTINFLSPWSVHNKLDLALRFDASVAGLLVAIDSEEMDEKLKELSIPAVNVGRHYKSKHHTNLFPDFSLEARLAFNALWAMGHRNFAYIGYAMSFACSMRIKALQKELSAHGHCLKAFWLSLVHVEIKQALESIMLWLSQQDYPLGLWVCNNDLATRVMQSCTQNGIRVPQDISILGIGTTMESDAEDRTGLSFIIHDERQLGYESMQTLDKLIRSRSNQTPPLTKYTAPSGVALRSSTDSLVYADEAVKRAMTLIAREACKGLHPSDVIANIPLSRRCLENRFKKCTGRSILAQIRHIQLMKAKLLLRKGQMNIAEISRQCGFVYPEHFHKVFKTITGMTPNAYRRAACYSWLIDKNTLS